MNKKEKYQIVKMLIILSIPTILEQLLSTLLQYVDTAMVGRLGENATAAVSVTTTITWLMGSISSAFSVAVIAMISKAIGSGEKEKVTLISQQVVAVVVGTGIVLGGISMALSPYIPIWMGAEKAVRKDASIYFFIISVPFIFRTSSTLFGAAVRATQNTKTPMLISTFANILNAILNVLLIYIVGLGVAGAAIASAVSYVVGGCMMFIAFRKNEHFNWKFNSFKLNKEILTEGMRLSLPVIGTNFASCLGYVFFAGMVSGMGTTIFAAHSIAVTAETCFYIPGYGIRMAASAMVGTAYGEKNKKKFDVISSISIMFTLILMVMTGIVLYHVAYPLMCIFTNSTKVAGLGAAMLKMVAFSEPFFGLMIISEGIMYGLGKTKYSFIVETGCMWGIRIAMTFVVVKIWHMGLTQVWYCMIADNMCKSLLLVLPVATEKRREKLFG